MDNKHDKKRESIDEILSDLNGLLNKMPSILDGIKMPEMQPAEFSKPAQAPEPQPPQPAAGNNVPAGPFDADKTVVLESFSGLSEGSQAPGEILSSPPEPASPQPEPASLGQGGVVPQSSGGFMFGQEAEAEPEKPAAAVPIKLSGIPLEPPPEKPVQNVGRGPSLSVSEFTPPSLREMAPAPQNAQFTEQLPASFTAQSEPALPCEVQPEKRTEVPTYETSRDFGIPDIDALIRMSEGEKPAAEEPVQSLPEAGLLPESIQTIEIEKDGSSIPALADSRTEAVPPASPGGFIIEPGIKPETSFEAFTIEPSSPEPTPAQDGGETLRLEPPVPEFMDAAALEPPSAEPQGLQEPFSGSAVEPEEANPEVQLRAPAEPEAEPRLEVGQGIRFGSDAESAAGLEPTPGIELGEGSPAQSVNPDETLPSGPGLEIGGPASPPS
ncbi:MAG: hypothetical protein AAB359_06675, partial [Elusimicrobiota bacterium]